MHIRQVEDQVLTFIVSGKLWRNSMIMMDKETGSLWNHITGECMEGAYLGKQLEIIPVVQTTWKAWSEAHPATRVLEKSEEVKSSRYERYFQDPERYGIFATDWIQDRLPGKTLVHGVNLGTDALAVTDEKLIVDKPVLATLGEVEISVVRDEDGGVRALRLDTDEPLIVMTAFWFAWSGYFPRTAVVD